METEKIKQLTISGWNTAKYREILDSSRALAKSLIVNYPLHNLPTCKFFHPII
jgi:hypothetical protein